MYTCMYIMYICMYCTCACMYMLLHPCVYRCLVYVIANLLFMTISKLGILWLLLCLVHKLCSCSHHPRNLMNVIVLRTFYLKAANLYNMMNVQVQSAHIPYKCIQSCIQLTCTCSSSSDF